MAKRPAPFAPYVLTDPACALGGSKFSRLFVLAETFCGVRAVYRRLHVESQLGVVDRILFDWQLKHYPRLELEQSSLQSSIDELKSEMLAHGASPEAVVLVGAVSPFDERELKIMAEKLTKKAAPAAKKPAKETKAAAPKAAKEPKVAADRKYKTLMTVKQAAEKFREGTWTAAMVGHILSNKSTAAAQESLKADKTYGDRRLDFSWAAKQGLISFD